MKISINKEAIKTDIPDRVYVDCDKIRLVVEDNELVGWYDPEQKLTDRPDLKGAN